MASAPNFWIRNVHTTVFGLTDLVARKGTGRESGGTPAGMSDRGKQLCRRGDLLPAQFPYSRHKARWMSGWLIVLLGVALSAHSQEHPPNILQVYRDFLKPGSEVAYARIEEDAARICLKLKCPHPYLAIESLSGPKEVWFLNGYDSTTEQKQVADAYARNRALIASLGQIVRRKASLTSEPANTFAKYREVLSHGAPWSLGRGRFLVITLIQGRSEIAGTIFETDDGMQFVIRPAQSRSQAEQLATADAKSRVFAIRPSWSLPAESWIAADPHFWRAPARHMK